MTAMPLVLIAPTCVELRVPISVTVRAWITVAGNAAIWAAEREEIGMGRPPFEFFNMRTGPTSSDGSSCSLRLRVLKNGYERACFFARMFIELTQLQICVGWIAFSFA